MSELPNSFWFTLLTIVSYVLFFITLYIKREAILVPLLLGISGLIYVVEYLILVLLNSYTYNPNYLEREYLDNILGSVPSNFVSVPIAATIIAAFRLGWKWIIAIDLMFVAIEIGFLKMEIYFHHWWELAYTATLFPILFLISRYWLHLLRTAQVKWLRWTTVYLMTMSLIVTIDFFLVVFVEPLLFTPGWFEDPYKDHIAGSAMYYMFVLTPLFVFTTLRNWIWKGAAIGVIMVLDEILVYFKCLEIATFWTHGHFLFLNITLFILLKRLYRWTIVPGANFS
ncbi:hypothetical protein [Marinicrinis sediminis]|uniref:Uncharacterized protein n=1 Tax=Marinicrinis sediminis TaxID=1652465 RepID=A0ABW5R736_9BACL